MTTITYLTPLSDVDKFVTDKSAPPDMIEQIGKQGVEVILAN